MKYITLNDLKTLLKENVINDLSENNYPLLDSLESYAISQVNAFIGFKFDVNASLQKRNPFIIMLLIDILSYHLTSRMTHVEVPDNIQQRYDDALKYLKDVSMGKITPDIPMNEEPMEYKEQNHYYTDTRINSQW